MKTKKWRKGVRKAILLTILLAALAFAIFRLFVANKKVHVDSSKLSLVAKEFVILLSDDSLNSSDYLLSSSMVTFAAAVNSCASMSASLAETRTARDRADLAMRLSTLRPRAWWLAASDREEEGVFRWLSDGERIQQEPGEVWSQGQPDNWPGQPGHPEEDCLSVVFDLDGRKKWRWNDLDCKTKLNYICKMKKST